MQIQLEITTQFISAVKHSIRSLEHSALTINKNYSGNAKDILANE